MTERPLISATTFAALLIVTALMAYVLDARIRPLGDESGHDPLYRLLGSAKEAIGDQLFLKADAYYHGGVAAAFAESEKTHGQEGIVHEDPLAEKKAPTDWIAVVNSQVRSRRHYHLTKKEQKEMLPFFAMATSLDPHNIEAVLTTAYWLDRHFNRSREAIAVLKKGTRNNPASWEIEWDLANVYFRRARDFRMSERHYREAIRKMALGDAEKHFHVQAWYLLGESCVQLGKQVEALEAYRAAVAFYGEGESDPLKEKILQKIRELSR